jgi:hypothetical protein
VSSARCTGPALAAPAAHCGERGQALLFALLALLLASMAAAFVAEDMMLREKAMQEESARLHVRALLDGALADALAKLDAHQPLVDPAPWGGGVTTVEGEAVPPRHAILRVRATWHARSGAAEAYVQLLPEVRVVSWHRTLASGG